MTIIVNRSSLRVVENLGWIGAGVLLSLLLMGILAFLYLTLAVPGPERATSIACEDAAATGARNEIVFDGGAVSKPSETGIGSFWSISGREKSTGREFECTAYYDDSIVMDVQITWN